MVNLEIVKIDKTLNLNNSYIYRLSLCNKREYIGYFKYTKKVNNLPERLWKHINGDGAEYVKKYKPKIIIIESLEKDINEILKLDIYKYLIKFRYKLRSWNFYSPIFVLPNSKILLDR